MEVDFSFLTPGVSYQATILKDAPTASEQPKEYVSETAIITKDSKLTFKMEKGGGFVIRLKDPSTTGLDNVNKASKVSINVNKSAATLFVNSETAIQSVSLYNLYGQCLLNERYGKNTTAQTINLTSLNRGGYIVKVQTEKTSSSLKFIY